MLGPAGKTKNDVTTGEGMPIVKGCFQQSNCQTPKGIHRVGQHNVASVVWKVLPAENRCSRELGALRYGVRLDTKEA